MEEGEAEQQGQGQGGGRGSTAAAQAASLEVGDDEVGLACALRAARWGSGEGLCWQVVGPTCACKRLPTGARRLGGP